MGIAEQSFAGQSINRPGVYGDVKIAQTPGAAGAVSNRVVVLGSSNGGIPYNATDSDIVANDLLQSFDSIPVLQDELQGGAAYYCGEFYLTPTTDNNISKPSEVFFVRVDPSTRASMTITETGVSPDSLITLKSRRFGTLANQIALKIIAGTNEGKKISVRFQGELIGERDDIALNFFTIQYTGAGSAAVMNITSTGLTTTVTGASGDNLSISFTDYPSLGQLVSYIDDLDVYTCTLEGQSDEDSDVLDVVSSQDIMTAEYTAAANVEAVIRFLNNEIEGGELIATLYTGADRTVVETISTFTFMTGGTKGVAANANWIAALQLLEQFEVNHILPATGDATILALVKTHCDYMSGVTIGKKRTYGSGAGSTVTTYNDRAAEIRALNHARGEYHVTPFYRKDVFNGNVSTEFAPFYGAALTAGIRFANHVTCGATFKSLNVDGVAEKYTPAVVKNYIGVGATLFEFDGNETTVVSSTTTYQGTNDIMNLPSAMRTVDYIDMDIRAKIKARIASMNRAPTAVIITDIQNWVLTKLLPDYETVEGVITADPNSGARAFSNVTFSLQGTAWKVSFRAIIPVELRQAFITELFEVVGTTAT